MGAAMWGEGAGMIEDIPNMVPEIVEAVRVHLKAKLRLDIIGLAMAHGYSHGRATVLADYAVSDPQTAISVVEMLAP